MNKRLLLHPLSILFILALIAAILRLVPYFYILHLEHGQGIAFPLLVSYLPTDFYCYLSFMRQAATEGRFFFHDPFTLEPQQGVFILTFFFILGKISALLSISCRDVFEISRLPLLVALTYTLWRFLNLFQWDHKQKFWAIALILFSGGIEGPIKLCTSHELFHENLWQFYGWNSFAAFFNPLWIFATILTLIVLRYALPATGPATWKQKIVLAFSFTLLHFSHSYSSIIALCVIFTSAVFDFSSRKSLALLYALFLPLAIILYATNWQLKDEVYRFSSSNFFGAHNINLFWYPMGLGVLLFMALKSSALWPSRVLSAWILPVVFLHHSDVVNGYKFLFYLHIPVVIMATPYFLHLVKNFPRLSCIILFPLLFNAPVFQTLEGINEIKSREYISPAIYGVVKRLQAVPKANLIAPPPLNNIIPAFTPHYVFSGHWFLTLDYQHKEKLYPYLLQHPQERAAVMRQFNIHYMIFSGEHPK